MAHWLALNTTRADIQRSIFRMESSGGPCFRRPTRLAAMGLDIVNQVIALNLIGTSEGTPDKDEFNESGVTSNRAGFDGSTLFVMYLLPMDVVHHLALFEYRNVSFRLPE